MATREQMSERTKRRLVEAAIKLFADHSYENATVGDISAAAGVTKGGFYHHYTSKEDLLLNIQERAVERVIEESEEVLARNLSASDTLRAYIHIQLRIVTEHRDALLASVSDRKALEPEKWGAIRAKRDTIEKMVIDVINRGQETGEFIPSRDPRLLAYGILGMCYWSNAWFRPDGGWSVEQIADQFATIALNGLVTRP